MRPTTLLLTVALTIQVWAAPPSPLIRPWPSLFNGVEIPKPERQSELEAIRRLNNDQASKTAKHTCLSSICETRAQEADAQVRAARLGLANPEADAEEKRILKDKKRYWVNYAGWYRQLKSKHLSAAADALDE